MSKGQNKARGELARNHYEDYRKLYLEEKIALLKADPKYKDVNSASQFRAYTKLIAMYPEEYRKLYQHYKKLLTPAK